MDELRNAANQTELVQAQRRLARVQRLAEKHGPIAFKKLTNTPQWILDEAREQQEWIAQKKAEKAAKAGGIAGSNKAAAAVGDQPGASSSSSGGGAIAAAAEEEEEPLLVECAGCAATLPWAVLASGDGFCPSCSSSAAGPSSVQLAPIEAPTEEEAASLAAAAVLALAGEKAVEPMPTVAEEPLLVECSKCSVATPWSELQLGDGVCPTCCLLLVGGDGSSTSAAAVADAAARAMEASPPAADASAAPAAAAQPRSAWRERRRQAAAAASRGDPGLVAAEA